MGDMSSTTAEGSAAAFLSETIAAMAGAAARPRPDQIAAVEALVEQRRRVLVVQATGWGKSAVYWAATRALRARGKGCTLVVSPLLALMRDQIAAAERAGLRAATINSTNVDDWSAVMSEVRSGFIDVLLVSPERLANPRFAAQLPALLADCGLLVIDEAHCVSDWGFDFRPDYQRLTRTLLSLAPGTPVLATTATANARVTADVAQQLGEDTATFRGSLARASLRLAVVPKLGPLQRYAWVADALATLPGSGIVYVLTVAETERVTAFLSSQGFDVAAYSSKNDPAMREELEDRLRRNEVKALVATSALGMGYDKPDLAFCLHLGSPASPVAYYQQVGRAGRALDDAVAVLLPSDNDEQIWDYFATAGIPDPDQVDRILDALHDGHGSVPSLETATGIRRGRVEALLKIMAVDGAAERAEGGWIATGQRWIYDRAKWSELAKVRAAEADLMRHFARGDGCLMQFLQQSLDDPDPKPCGQCSVCTGELPAPGATPHPATIRAAQLVMRGMDTIIEPRKLWPSGLSGHRGRIAGLLPGRALAFADDPAWSGALAELWQGESVPSEVLDGLVHVLARWSRDWVRPVALVPMPSRRRSAQIQVCVEHLARIGRLPLVDALEIVGPRPDERASSKARAEALFAGLRVRDGVVVPDGPILLVDDQCQTRWTLTVAAALLLERGVSQVAPLVIHQLP